MEKCPYAFPNDGAKYRIAYKRNFTESHRDPSEGPALVIADSATVSEFYHWEGVPHRLDGPAERKWDRKSRLLLQESHFVAGRAHRDPQDGAALRIFANGRIKYEEYLFWNAPYRDPSEGPSRLWYNAKGQLTQHRLSTKRDFAEERVAIVDLLAGPFAPLACAAPKSGCPHSFPTDAHEVRYEVEYTRDGLLHRDPEVGPARILSHRGNVSEGYFWMGAAHRADAPAIRAWDQSGELVHEKYFWRGREYRGPFAGPAVR